MLRKKPSLLSELNDLHHASLTKTKKIADIVRAMVDENRIIDSVEAVRKEIEEKHNLTISSTNLRSIMRDEAGLRFKKVK